MSPSMSVRLGSAVLVAAALVGIGPAAGSAQEVTMFEQAPSLEALERAMNKARSTGRTRSVVFGEGERTAPARPRDPAPLSTATAMAAPPARAQPAARDEVEVSADAIGFPITFDLNSARIKAEAIPFLNSIAAILIRDPEMKLLIEGHTDASGGYMHNLTLSQARAMAVRNYLVVQFGIDGGRLRTLGKGPAEPLDPARPLSPGNRRVQFRIMG